MCYWLRVSTNGNRKTNGGISLSLKGKVLIACCQKGRGACKSPTQTCIFRWPSFYTGNQPERKTLGVVLLNVFLRELVYS